MENNLLYVQHKQCKQKSLVNWKDWLLDKASMRSLFPRARLSSTNSSPLKSKGSVFHSWCSYEWAYTASRESQYWYLSFISWCSDKRLWQKQLEEEKVYLTHSSRSQSISAGKEGGRNQKQVPSHSYSRAQSKKPCMLVLSLQSPCPPVQGLA